MKIIHLGMGPMGPLTTIHGAQNFMELASSGFPALPPPIPIPNMNDSQLEFTTNKSQSVIIRDNLDDNDRRCDKSESRRDRDSRDNRDSGRRYLIYFLKI